MIGNMNLVIMVALFSLCAANMVSSLHQDPPLLMVNLGTDFETNETTWEHFISEKRVVPKKSEKAELEIECSAGYPIMWNISGYLYPTEIVKIQPSIRKLAAEENKIVNIFSIKVIIFFEDESASASSASVSCQDVSNWEQNAFVHVFVPGIKPLIRSKDKVSIVTVGTDSVAVLPCATTNPNIPVTLQRQTDSASGDEVMVESESYDPFQGFKLRDPIAGLYICRTTPDDQLKVEIQLLEDSPLVFYPGKSDILLFTSDQTLVNCTSLDPNEVVLISSEINFDYILNEAASKVLVLRSEQPTKGTLSCSTSSHNHRWHFKIIEAPKMYLDNFEGEADCLSDDFNKSVATVRCKNHNDCQYFSQCFDDPASCNVGKRKHFQADTPKSCYIQSEGRGVQCSSLPFAHLNGLVQCTVDGLTKTWEFFVSLHYRRYASWTEVPIHELIRMDEVNETLYKDHNSTFFCEATSFLFADSLLFSLEYQNGTTAYIIEPGLVTNPEIEDERRIDEFNVLGILKIQLPLEAVAVHCHAPWLNGSDIISIKKSFNVKELLSPSMQQESGLMYDFIIGDENQRLVCHAEAEPSPIYVWLKDETAIDFRNKSTFRLSTSSNGESILEFTTVDSSNQGTYRCEASNGVGNDSSNFHVQTKESPGSRWIYLVFGLAFGIICAIFLALIVLLKKYRATQLLLRQLTKEEIDEFINGKPEFLEAAQNSPDCLDFVPYDKSFEVPMDDLDLDVKNVLGSGEYAIVVKGMIKSAGSAVAIKIAKPIAGVMYFKSLLSELKIMIYIGRHPNIVSLLGAVTENILDRSLHIIVEYCEYGSLDRYLRKHKNEFCSYIGEKSGDLEIRTYENFASSTTLRMTTLDLILWAHQISSGMAYLAQKSVVHADLATRNVLLTSQKIAKVSDFGLSKKLYESGNYVKKSKVPLPWRWMALEALSTLTFSTQTDIWAFGVTLWEIFSLGDVPYPNEAWNAEFIKFISSGMRMGRPKFSSIEIYSKIIACWDENPNFRPSFPELVEYFHSSSKTLLRKSEGSQPNARIYSNVHSE